jgi:hypothetical protein
MLFGLAPIPPMVDTHTIKVTVRKPDHFQHDYTTDCEIIIVFYRANSDFLVLYDSARLPNLRST